MGKIYKILPVVIFLLLAFIPSPNPPPSGWYQQFMPNLGGRQISDIFFLDSLTGWAVTPYVNVNDTAFVLKTTNGGDNWFFVNVRAGQFVGHNKIKFLNTLTGFVCGNFQTSGYQGLNKSTDGGTNWFFLNNPPTTAVFDDMAILNENIIWLVASSSLTGGVFRTTNGGANWDRQLNLGSQNPNHIYMFNDSLGFICKDNIYLRRTTNGGLNWDTISGAGGFLDMYFVDSLTGWKTSVQKTTDGGLTWVNQTLPSGGDIILSQINEFSNISSDTIWGVGGYVFWPGYGNRGMIYRTTNSGINWLFQVADTNINIGRYLFTKFTSRFTGWAYSNGPGVRTTSGGDPIWYTGIQQISNAVPEKFVLKQNYPNPFNPRTVIPYSLSASAHVKIIAYDITGKEVQQMVDNYQQAGAYEVDFMGKFTASGVYFYRMTVDGVVVGTKKMILLK